MNLPKDTWASRHLVPEWKQWHHIWTVQIDLFTVALSGAWMAWPAFQGYMNRYTFAAVCVFLAAARLGLRLVKQKKLKVDNA